MTVATGFYWFYEPIPILFKGLKRYEPQVPGSHKSVCPVCKEGLLLMCRDFDTGELLARDRCTLCGQRFDYLDIEQVRKELP